VAQARLLPPAPEALEQVAGVKTACHALGEVGGGAAEEVERDRSGDGSRWQVASSYAHGASCWCGACLHHANCRMCSALYWLVL